MSRMERFRRLLSGVFAVRSERSQQEVPMFNMSQQATVAGGVTGITGSRHAPLELSEVVAGKPVHLVQVVLDGRPFPPAKEDTTFCLDVHENRNAISAALKYVKQTLDVEPGAKLRFTPSIFALVNTSALSSEELHIVNSELIPAGASIFEYPKTCKSFPEAMNALFREFKATYRAHAKDEYKPSIFELIGYAVGTLVGRVASAQQQRCERVISEEVVSQGAVSQGSVSQGMGSQGVVSERASSSITKASAAE
jgi:hypothetical protein